MSKRQRVDGVIHRSLAATLSIREADPAISEPDGLMRLRLSVASDIPALRTPFWDDPWIETLGMKDGEVDLSRLNAGAAILANHDRYNSIGKTPLAGIGSIEKAWVEGGRIIADLVISRREDLADMRQDITDNLVKNVSIGYRINERVLTKAAGSGTPNEYRVTKWMPFEVSLVDVPMDASVGLGRSIDGSPVPPVQYRIVDLPALGVDSPSKGDSIMPEIVKAADSQAAPEVENQVRSETVPAQSIAASVATISEAVRVAGFSAEVALDMVGRGLSIEAARAELFAKMADKANASPTRSGSSHIETIVDAGEVRRSLMAEAVSHKLTPGKALSDGAREYRHMSLIDLARAALFGCGQRVTGLSSMEIAQRAMHGVSDFPLMLADVANKRLSAAYEAAATTYQIWAKRAPNAPDFKDMRVVNLGAAPNLLLVPPSGEFKRGTVGEASEKYAVLTYGRILAFNRQMIINDDLRGLDTMISQFAAAAKRLENQLVYEQLTNNVAMADGELLYSTAHGNYVGTGTALSDVSLGVARKNMRKQVGLQGEKLNVVPVYLLVPVELEQTAYRYTSASYVPAKPADINEFRAGGRTALEPVVEPLLSDVSATGWYLASDPNAMPTVEYCWLDGAEGVYIENRMGFDVDGMELKARLDFAAKVTEYRGLHLNLGA